jgi:hypothetical protein
LLDSQLPKREVVDADPAVIGGIIARDNFWLSHDA